MRSMQRKGRLIAAAFCLLLALAGCSNYRVDVLHMSVNEKKGEENQSFWSKYASMSGNEDNYITLKEGDPLEFRIQITTTQGSLSVVAEDPDGAEIYNQTYTEDAQFTLPVKTAGKYKLTMKGDKHSGGYAIKWGKEEDTP